MRSEICRGTPEVLQQEVGVAGTDQQTFMCWSLPSWFLIFNICRMCWVPLVPFPSRLLMASSSSIFVSRANIEFSNTEFSSPVYSAHRNLLCTTKKKNPESTSNHGSKFLFTVTFKVSWKCFCHIEVHTLDNAPTITDLCLLINATLHSSTTAVGTHNHQYL